MPDQLKAAIEGVIGLLNEMHPHSGCGSDPCTMRTDLCIARANLIFQYELSQVQI